MMVTSWEANGGGGKLKKIPKQTVKQTHHIIHALFLTIPIKHLPLDLVKDRTLSYTELCNLPQDDILFKLLFYGTFIDFIYF